MQLNLGDPIFILLLVAILVVVLIIIGLALARRRRRRAEERSQELRRQKQLDGIISSYIKAHEKPKAELDILKYHLLTEGFDLDDATLEKLIEEHQRLQSFEKRDPFVKAALFADEKAPRRYRPGSAFCPNPACKQFKNYEKECPHCGFHEIAKVGRGSYFCPQCGYPKSYTATCPVCNHAEASAA